MKKLKHYSKLFASWIVFIALFLFVILGIANKDKMNKYISNTLINNATPELHKSGAAFIDSAYNYLQNNSNFSYSFIEFGAQGCSACRRMEKVMSEIKDAYPQKVNVVFYNITKPESQTLMKYFGVVAIPTQIILNSHGKEIFRHTGFISAKDLDVNFK